MLTDQQTKTVRDQQKKPPSKATFFVKYLIEIVVLIRVSLEVFEKL